MQFNPGQLYFLGREASDRLQQAAKLGLEGGDQAFDLTIKTVQFHVDAMTRLMTQTSHVKDFDGIKKLWSELFELMRQHRDQQCRTEAHDRNGAQGHRNVLHERIRRAGES